MKEWLCCRTMFYQHNISYRYELKEWYQSDMMDWSLCMYVQGCMGPFLFRVGGTGCDYLNIHVYITLLRKITLNSHKTCYYQQYLEESKNKDCSIIWTKLYLFRPILRRHLHRGIKGWTGKSIHLPHVVIVAMFLFDHILVGVGSKYINVHSYYRMISHLMDNTKVLMLRSNSL